LLEGDMPTPKPTPEDLERITELARRWGKIIAREQWGEHGPGLDVPLDQMEQVATAALRGLLAGTLEAATQQQARQLTDQQPCPDCGRLCPVVTEDRTITTGGGPFEHREPKAHCPDCRRDFFPPTSAAGTDQPRLQPRCDSQGR
jgi:hypothetical protein